LNRKDKEMKKPIDQAEDDLNAINALSEELDLNIETLFAVLEGLYEIGIVKIPAPRMVALRQMREVAETARDAGREWAEQASDEAVQAVLGADDLIDSRTGPKWLVTLLRALGTELQLPADRDLHGAYATGFVDGVRQADEADEADETIAEVTNSEALTSPTS
jgi:hypothetical protein